MAAPNPLSLPGLSLVAAPVAGGLAQARHTIDGVLRRQLGGGEFDVTPYAEPAGDPGLIGPDSVTWRIYQDMPSMLIGGVSALMLQTLHPKAMAGVADHSNWQEDPLGRLQRTGEFVATTAFGPTESAERMIAIVRRVHERVVGTTAAGEPYEANDPDLLTWVHMAEVSSFLHAYQRFSGRHLRRDEIDRFYAEISVVAVKLGAAGVPTTRDEARDYFRAVRPQLDPEPRAFDTLDFLVRGPATAVPDRLAYGLVAQAAIGLLPGWARDLLGLRQPRLMDRAAIRPATFAVAEVLRWALGPSPIVAVSRDRAQGLAPAA